MPLSDIIIRPYTPADRPAVRRISFETSFAGQPKLFLDNEELVADLLTLYYTDYEPQSCFVAEKPGRGVVGYTIGTTDARRMSRTLAFKIVPRAILTFLRSGLLGRKDVACLVWNCLLACFRGEFLIPDAARQYPAQFHINITEGYRGSGLGHRLVDHYLKFLKEKNLIGVHVNTMSDRAKEFFLSFGFQLYYTKNRKYLHYRFGHDHSYQILVLKLSARS